MLLDGLLQDPPWKEPSKVAFNPISTEARAAFQREILPQIGKIKSAEDLQRIIGEVTAIVNEAAKAKDTFYTRLVRHKAIDQVDDAFFADILVVLQQWAKDTLDKLREAPAQTEAPKTENRIPKVEPSGEAPPPEPAPQPVAPAPVAPAQPVMQPAVMQPAVMQPVMPVMQQPVVVQPAVDPIQALRNDIANQLGPAQNLTPWDLVRSLQTVFQQHGVRTANASARSKTAVTVGFGTLGVKDVVLQHRPGRGWFTTIGREPSEAAQVILARMARAG